VNEKITFSKNIFLFQGATAGIEIAVYKKLIAPSMNDMPATHSVGLRRACADKKYAYIGINALNTAFGGKALCQLVPLPGTFLQESMGFYNQQK
jgi:hypothetical protein